MSFFTPPPLKTIKLYLNAINFVKTLNPTCAIPYLGGPETALGAESSVAYTLLQSFKNEVPCTLLPHCVENKLRKF